MTALPTHGTLTRYLKYKCRCDLCRAKWSDYQKSYRARRKEARDGGVPQDIA